MLLQFEHVSKTYAGGEREVRALDNVSMTLDAGQFVAVRGPSGCGKSTLLLTAGGLLNPGAGTVSINGTAIYDLSPEQRARFRAESVGFVFQQFHLVPYLSVIDNVLAATLAAPIKNARNRASDLLQQFNLDGRSSHVPAELSTGERQRTALARALMHQPALLLADEPTGNLDPENAGAVLDALQSFGKAGGAVLLVTHDDRAAAAADLVMHMDAGKFA